MLPIPTLQRAVEERHDCFALLRDIVRVLAHCNDGRVWDGAVVAFSLAGHPTAEIAYAWSDLGPEPGHLQLYVAVHAGSIDSPQAAVRLMMGRERLHDAQAS